MLWSRAPQVARWRWFRSFSSVMSKLAKVADVDIDSAGKFKYILINVKDPETKSEKTIVRGYARSPFHADILEEVEHKQLQGLVADCPGGGRILHKSDEKSIKVYGYSQGFGQADHLKAVELLKTKYPDYTITHSNDGY